MIGKTITQAYRKLLGLPDIERDLRLIDAYGAAHLGAADIARIAQGADGVPSSRQVRRRRMLILRKRLDTLNGKRRPAHG